MEGCIREWMRYGMLLEVEGGPPRCNRFFARGNREMDEKYATLVEVGRQTLGIVCIVTVFFFPWGNSVQVEPLGRNPQLEALGYLAKQAYWVRCQSCINGELQAKLRASITGASGSMDGREGSDAPQDEKREGGVGDEAGKGDNSAGVGGEADAAESESESESDSEPEPEPKPQPMAFAVALTLLRDHPSAKAAFLQPR